VAPAEFCLFGGSPFPLPSGVSRGHGRSGWGWGFCSGLGFNWFGKLGTGKAACWAVRRSAEKGQKSQT